MYDIFSSQAAEALVGAELIAAKQKLVASLCDAIGMRLNIVGDETTIHCTDVQSCPPSPTWHVLSWEGIIGTTDYRDDGRLAYWAFLFPLLGGTRVCVARIKNNVPQYDYAYRYLLLEPEGSWKDYGWQIDDYGEFEHWYFTQEKLDKHD